MVLCTFVSFSPTHEWCYFEVWPILYQKVKSCTLIHQCMIFLVTKCCVWQILSSNIWHHGNKHLWTVLMFSNIHLVPDHITYSGRQWSSSSKGPGHSRSYSSSERSWQDTYWEKDIGSDGLNSASHDIPMTVSKAMMMHRYNVPTSTSSITLGTMGLSMAETLAQGPPRSHSPQVCLMLNSILNCFSVEMFSLLLWYIFPYSYLLVLKSLKRWPLSNPGY